MDCLTFISKLVEHSAWPLSAIFIVVILRKPITNLIDKLKRANIKGSEFYFTNLPIQTQTNTAPSSINIPIPADPLGLVKEFEQPILSDLNAANFQSDEEKVNILVSHLAATQLDATYQRINSYIFGSQVDLLRSLNSMQHPADLSSVKLFYDDAAGKYPEFYKNYPFHAYASFLTNIGVMALHENGYQITKLGKGYLMHIAEYGLTGFRYY